MPNSNQSVIIINPTSPPFEFPIKPVVKGLAAVLVIILLVLLLAPVNLYLNLYSRFYPHALMIDNTPISWDLLKKEVNLVSFDNSLKTRQQKLETALEKSVELHLLRSAIATPSAFSSSLTLYAEHRTLREQLEQNLVNWKTGGYFMARFNIPQATESAEIIQGKAKTEIVKLQERLRRGEDFNKLLVEAKQNEVLKTLNETAFLPGTYLDRITPPQFPLRIKGFRDQFFNLKTGQVSDIITLSWDDYDGPNYGGKLAGEFAYAVARVDTSNEQNFTNFEEWLRVQRQKVKVQSNILIPFFFAWF